MLKDLLIAILSRVWFLFWFFAYVGVATAWGIVWERRVLNDVWSYITWYELKNIVRKGTW